MLYIYSAYSHHRSDSLVLCTLYVGDSLAVLWSPHTGRSSLALQRKTRIAVSEHDPCPPGRREEGRYGRMGEGGREEGREGGREEGRGGIPQLDLHFVECLDHGGLEKVLHHSPVHNHAEPSGTCLLPGATQRDSRIQCTGHFNRVNNTM